MSNIFAGREFDMLDRRFQDAERVWLNVRTQLNNNPSFAMAVQGMVFAALDKDQIEFILCKFIEEIGVYGMFARDASINRVFLAPQQLLQTQPLLQVAGQIPILMQTIAALPQSLQSTPSPSSTSTPPSTPQADEGNVASPSGKPAKIPRPPNAFIIYRKAHHATIVAENPGLHNNQISVIIGAMWNGESAQVRADFKAQAESLKLEHLRKHPDYQYRPRKPSEKKKRMSKKKAAALADKAAAENRVKSVQIISQYDALPQPSPQLITTLGGTHHMALPAPNLPSADALLQQFNSDPVDGEAASVELPYDLSPSASYAAAQEADMSFFPDIDVNDPAFQALINEVGEAYEAGYYDDLLLPANQCPQPSDMGYELIDYSQRA